MNQSNTLTSLNINFTENSTKKLPTFIIAFSHLRWDFVYQRPQHLLTRFARTSTVYFIEEPVFAAIDEPHYIISKKNKNIQVAIPQIPFGLSNEGITDCLRKLLADLLADKELSTTAFWYYTPMALEYSRCFKPGMVIFDCMDELSAFKFAPESIKLLERELLNKADLVFAGGQSLYEAKKGHHHNIHAFPSSIDKEHFRQARHYANRHAGTFDTMKPKLGFYGVIDERFDIELIKSIADQRPHWQIELIGPVVKIDRESLPQNANIEYLGPKSYEELPLLIATWDIALIPFLLNESTRFISPTKTPEYLAAGLPVISSPIMDVVNPYGQNGLVEIAKTADEFIAAAELLLNRSDVEKATWLKATDRFLVSNSWDTTTDKMMEQVSRVLKNKSTPAHHVPVQINA